MQGHNRHNTVTIYTDGSYVPDTQRGGYAAFLIYPYRTKLIGKRCEAKHIHEVELRAIVQGVRAVRGRYRVVVYTDSHWFLERYRCRFAFNLEFPRLWEQFEYVCSNQRSVRFMVADKKDKNHQRAHDRAYAESHR